MSTIEFATRPQEQVAPAPEQSGEDRERYGSAVQAMAKARELEELERVRRAVMAAGEAAYHWHIDSDRLSWSTGSADVLDIEDADQVATGRGFANLLDADNFTSRFDTVMRTSEVDEGGGVPFTIEYLWRPKGREEKRAIWLEDTGRWYAGEDNRPAEVFGIVRRIDDRHHRDQHLSFLGNCDPLTGMMNRARLGDALGEALTQAKTDGANCAFLIAAINDLDVVNEAYGFEMADEVVAAIGRRLRDVVRAGDSIGRYSGSKFGLVLGNCSEADLEIAAERFLGVARESVVETERGPVWAMLSIGGLLLPKHAADANTAMALAEEALAEAKRRPADGFVAYRPSQERVSARELNARCATDIVASLREERLTLAYQPIVDANTGKVAMHEALLRMCCAGSEPVAAAHLIPVAEKLGLVRLVDRQTMHMALETVRSNPDTTLALNVSGITATDPRWFNQLTDLLAQNRDLTSRLVIEITETVALNDIAETERFINSLRELGCRVAIDDFGAGYTSFRNLKVLDVDMVKIDGSFCENLANNDENRYFVRSLLDLAKNFGLATVAEWVQSEADAELLRSWGIDFLQGNLFGAAEVKPSWLRTSQEAEADDAPPVTAAAPAEGGDEQAEAPADDAPAASEAPPSPPLEPNKEPDPAPPEAAEPDRSEDTMPGGREMSRLKQALAALDSGFGRAATG